MKTLPLILCAAALCAPAQAHIVAQPAEAAAGAYQAMRFQVGHGCGQAATTGLRIDIPQAVRTARPQPKTGWRLSIVRDGDRVASVTWQGDLPADQFDDFAVLVQVPAEAGPLYFPAVQTCDQTVQQWTELPEPGQTSPMKRPAPRVMILPTVPETAHVH